MLGKYNISWCAFSSVGQADKQSNSRLSISHPTRATCKTQANLPPKLINRAFQIAKKYIEKNRQDGRPNHYECLLAAAAAPVPAPRPRRRPLGRRPPRHRLRDPRRCFMRHWGEAPQLHHPTRVCHRIHHCLLVADILPALGDRQGESVGPTDCS